MLLTKKKRVVAVAECYLIITHVKNKESKKQPFNKKRRNLLVPSLQYCQFGQDDRKNRIFSGSYVEYELPVKYLENLTIEKVCCYIACC